MSKEIFFKAYTEKVNKNYSSLEFYFNDRLAILSALSPVKYEVINCLMIEQYQASITLTNHMVERMLKLALIEKTIYGLKIGLDDIELDNKLKEATRKYDRQVMSKSIESALTEGLIIDKERDYLYNIIRDNIRNGFSHAEMEKVNNGKPDYFEMRSYNFGEITNSLKGNSSIPHNQVNVSTLVPTMQSEIQKMKAEAIAFPYFKSIYKIAKNIDRRLDTKGEYYK